VEPYHSFLLAGDDAEDWKGPFPPSLSRFYFSLSPASSLQQKEASAEERVITVNLMLLAILTSFFFFSRWIITVQRCKIIIRHLNNLKKLKVLSLNSRPVWLHFFSGMPFYIGLGLAPRALPVDFKTFYSVLICYPWSPKVIFLYLEQRMSICLEHMLMTLKMWKIKPEISYKC